MQHNTFEFITLHLFQQIVRALCETMPHDLTLLHSILHNVTVYDLSCCAASHHAILQPVTLHPITFNRVTWVTFVAAD